MSTTDLKYYRNHALRAQILELADVEPLRSFEGARGGSREFKIAERRELTKAIVFMTREYSEFEREALTQRLHQISGQELNSIIEQRVGLDMNSHASTGNRGRASKFTRDELKQIYHCLCEHS